MNIVRKYRLGDSIRVLKSLTSAETKALNYAFIHKSGSVNQRKMAAKIAEFLKDHEAWLQCDCVKENRPLLTVGISIKGHYYLKHLNQRGKHHPSCCFRSLGHRSSGISVNYQKPCGNKAPLRLHRRATVTDSDDLGTSHVIRTDSTNPTPRLARVLYSWIEKSQLNQLDILDQYSLKERVQRLRQEASLYELETGIQASYYVWTYPDVAQMISRLETNGSQWPKNSRPYAICIAVADYVEDKSFHFLFKDKAIRVDCFGRVKGSSGRIGKNSGPFLVIFTVTDSLENPGSYHAYHAFYVPVYSKFQWIPVDSVYERQVLAKIAKRAKWWVREHQLNVTVKKPLFGIPVFDGDKKETIKPDFLIETPFQNIIFEVMGSHEEDYITRKNRVVPLMKLFGKVIEFDALSADQEKRWDETLKKAIRCLSALVFEGNEN